MPSSVHPAHAPQNPVICWRLSRVRVCDRALVKCSLVTASPQRRGSHGIGSECVPGKESINGIGCACILKHCTYRGLYNLSHRVARKGIEEQKPCGQFIGRQELSSPMTQAG